MRASQAFSTRTWRGGIASRSTSFADPAARSATARASRHTSGRSTGTVETTAATSLSGPGKSASAASSTTYAVASRFALRSGTDTRMPGATPSSESGMR